MHTDSLLSCDYPFRGPDLHSLQISQALHKVPLSSLLAVALSHLEFAGCSGRRARDSSPLPIASLATHTQSTPPPSLGAAPVPQAPRIWAHIGAHYSCCSLICPLLGAAHRLKNGAGSWPRMGTVWGGGHSPFRRHCSPTPALEEVPGLCLGSCYLSALPASLPLSLSIPPHPVPSQGPP